jgi:succinate dehydrogenase flavin-adding protein (antitoxin of CptAB toxin-antitoxin module)
MTDTILESVLAKFRQRSEVGQRKYNTTLDRKDLTLLDWINHAQEEAMDLSLYLEKLKQKLFFEGINVD